MSGTSNPGGRTRTCKLCEQIFALHEIRRCPVCHTYFCRTCGVIAGGRRFCSRGCGLFDAFYDPPDAGSSRQRS
jgi:hypothetical protein